MDRKNLLTKVGVAGVVLGALVFGNGLAEFIQNRVSPTPFELPEFPGPFSPEKEKKVFNVLIKKLAKETGVIAVKDECELAPTIARVREGTILVFKNEDLIEHNIEVAGENIFVPRKGEKSITVRYIGTPQADVSGTEGVIYSIRCDFKPRAGALEVLPLKTNTLK